MNVKIQKQPFQSNLTGAALLAFAVLESKLVSGIGRAIGTSTWELACNTVATLTSGMDTPTATAAIEKYKTDAIRALQSREVNAAVEAAGLGDVSSIQYGDDGKQKSLGKDVRHLSRLYGVKFRLGPQLDRATATIKQYCDNIALAVGFAGKIEARVAQLKAITERSADEQRELDALTALDVSYKGKTVQQVVRQNRDAAEAFNPAKLAARREQETARNVGQSIRDIYAKADDSLRHVVHTLNVIMDGWQYATAEQREMAVLAIEEAAQPFADAKAEHDKAEAAANAEGQSTEGGASELPNVPETSDESVHATATNDTDTQGSAEPARAAA